MSKKPFYRTKHGVEVTYETVGDEIASKHPELIGKHIFEQLDALPGWREAFTSSESPYSLPYSFSEYATVKPGKPKVCEDCRGNGWLIFEDDEIMRCDSCDKYEGDLEAAIAYFKSPGCKHVLDLIKLRTTNKHRTQFYVEKLSSDARNRVWEIAQARVTNGSGAYFDSIEAAQIAIDKYCEASKDRCTKDEFRVMIETNG